MIKKIKIVSVVGARPNFMKIAPLLREFQDHKEIESILVHTGQHYTDRMSDIFFKDLKIGKYVALNVGAGAPLMQIKKIMARFSKVLLKVKPHLVVVVGDVNSTLACALVAKKLGIKVAHVEAGLRSFDEAMPEEINRKFTDAVSDYLFATEPSALKNLKNEGIPDEKIFFVGNIMIDSLISSIAEARKRRTLDRFGLKRKEYVLLTLHRPSNVDDAMALGRILGLLGRMRTNLKIIYPIHPRSVKMLKKFGYWSRFKSMPDIIVTEPLGYLDFLRLMIDARFVLTDSGGIQEETTYLGIPCFTLRKNTERPITVTQGTNRIVGSDYGKLLRLIDRIPSKTRRRKLMFWDGNTAKRISRILRTKLKQGY